MHLSLFDSIRKAKRQIAHAARRKGISKSEVIRRALDSCCELDDTSDSPYTLLADLIRVVSGR